MHGRVCLSDATFFSPAFLAAKVQEELQLGQKLVKDFVKVHKLPHHIYAWQRFCECFYHVFFLDFGGSSARSFAVNGDLDRSFFKVHKLPHHTHRCMAGSVCEILPCFFWRFTGLNRTNIHNLERVFFGAF